jgi:hypothetical protein
LSKSFAPLCRQSTNLNAGSRSKSLQRTQLTSRIDTRSWKDGQRETHVFLLRSAQQRPEFWEPSRRIAYEFETQFPLQILFLVWSVSFLSHVYTVLYPQRSLYCNGNSRSHQYREIPLFDMIDSRPRSTCGASTVTLLHISHSYHDTKSHLLHTTGCVHTHRLRSLPRP